MIKIYGRISSSNVRKVLWLVAELGLSAERLDYGRGFTPTDTPAYRALNPNGLVPTMDDGGFILWESHAILRYLAARSEAHDWYPADIRQRGVVDQWLDWLIGELQPPVRDLMMGVLVKSPPYDSPEAIAEATSACERRLRVLDDQLQRTGGYVAGALPTIADCAVGMMVHRWFGLEVERTDFPAVTAYYDRLQTRPAFMATIPPGGP
jgi:glutathione S-transferase